MAELADSPEGLPNDLNDPSLSQIAMNQTNMTHVNDTKINDQSALNVSSALMRGKY